MRPVLGIETSCDETATAVLDEDGRVLAEAVASQEREHAPYGGVVPEIAARAHLAILPEQVQRVMRQAGLGFDGLGGVAASAGPGLIGGLIVGSQFAKGIAIAHRVPYVAVNHLEAHALTARLPGLVPRVARVSRICCCWCRAGTASAWRWKGWGGMSGSVARWTTRRARRSTRWQSCWGWAGRVGRRWSGWRRAGMRGGSRSLGRCWGGWGAISAFPG